ncbi:hypothetical protein JR316_0000670 [Psilocybe cubensis]|uniref:Uncharacterized protein n=2 Tax=Psilocybe cubensis TaxID=181762 RepID=A0ACB8HHL6_PSICU|nr:hypothetical protein JR316_0000670 [Psilocybe cubensis]KAH9486605.1 hypothetical protein JR316_0000670 [Psilocybe cubensis]
MSLPEPAKPRRSVLAAVVYLPFTVFIAFLATVLPALRPFAPRLVPLFVCSLFIPLVLLLSFSAAYVVWSSLSVSWQVPLYLQYGDGVPPYAFVFLPSLVPNQRYDISVNLILPCTEANIQLGNFMASLTLSTLNNKTLEYVRRPAIVLPARNPFWLSSKTIDKVKIPMLQSFIAGKANLAAKVEIGRHDSWTTLGQGYGREVNVASASLQGLVVPHGIRGLAIRFPLISALVSGGIFLCILSAILGTCILPLLLPAPQAEEEEEDTSEVKVEKTQLQSVDIPESRRGRRTSRRRRSRSVKSSDDKEIKVEESAQNIIPEDDGSTKSLRRRPTKLAAQSDEE